MEPDEKAVSLSRRFWEKVEKTDGCWLWIASTNRKGYGRFGIDACDGMRLAHRWSWEIHNGPIPDGLCVLHRCDVPACVNPAHLFLGTRVDNNADMERKGRGNRVGWRNVRDRRPGELRHNSKLTVERVREIRVLYEAGDVSYTKLGRLYGVGRTTIEQVVKRKKWAHVE